MKKLSETFKQKHIRLSKKRHIKNLFRKKSSVKSKKKIHIKVKELKDKYSQVPITFKKGVLEIKAPKIMRLSQNNDYIMQFLQCLRETVSLKISQFKVDFTTIEELSPLCAMLMATEIHRWQLIRKKKMKIYDSDSWKPEIKKLFKDIGVFDLIRVINPYYLDPIDTEERYITITSANEVNLQKALEHIVQEVSKVYVLLRSNPLLYGGIEEAVTNVSQWAYKGNNSEIPKEITNRWWFLTSYNIKTKRITIMVYDHGVGIPNTLPTYKWKENVLKWLQDKNIEVWTDEKIIEAAMKMPRSASGQPYRAKGLKKMRELLAMFDKSTLFIYSGKGEYKVDQSNNESIELHKNPIGGTLIVWEVYIGEEENEY